MGHLPRKRHLGRHRRVHDHPGRSDHRLLAGQREERGRAAGGQGQPRKVPGKDGHRPEGSQVGGWELMGVGWIGNPVNIC